MTGVTRCAGGRGTGCTCIPDRGYQPKNKGNLPGDLQGPFLTPLRRASREIRLLVTFLQCLETPSRGWWCGTLSLLEALWTNPSFSAVHLACKIKLTALCHRARSITCDTTHARGMLYGDKYHLIRKDDFRIAWFQKKRTVSMFQLQASRVLSWIFGGKKVKLSGEAQ